MLQEELKDQVLNVKVNYLNGYLAAMEWLNSYSIVGMRCKLFAFSFYAGDIEKCIQDNSYELFGVNSGEWTIELEKADDWEARLQSELNASLKRRVPVETDKAVAERFDYSANALAKDLNFRTGSVNEHFIRLFKNEFIRDGVNVYELKIEGKGAAYRLVGIDLVFEIDANKLLFLQILGND